MEPANHYDILGIPRDATPADIKRAYRKRFKKAHPDKGGSPDDFRALQDAYETLSDPEARRCYDTGEVAPSNLSQDARGYLVKLFFERFSNVGQDALFSDMFAHINRRISVDMLEERNRQTKVREKHALLLRLSQRVTCTAPPCIFTPALARQMAALDNSLRQGTRLLEMLSLAATMLQDYSFEPVSPLTCNDAAEHFKRCNTGGR